MSAPIPTTEPANLPAGDTATWQRTLASYPASDGWALTYTLVNASQRYTATATAVGDDHLINIPASTTATWAPGWYDWRAQASKSGQVFTVAAGRLQVLPTFGTATDARSHAQKVLEAIQAYLENPVNLAASEYEIAGRSLRRHSIPELLALRDRYQFEVNREANAQRAAAGLAPRGRIAVRFGA